MNEGRFLLLGIVDSMSTACAGSFMGRSQQVIRTVFPSSSAPAHSSIITGQTPAEHGIVSNSFLGPGGPVNFSSKDLSCKTVLDSVSERRHRVWSVGEFMLEGNDPHLNSNVPLVEDISKKAIRGGTNLLVVSLILPDAVCHQYGPNSNEYKDTVRVCLASLSRLVSFAKRNFKKVDFIVTSDHSAYEVETNLFGKLRLEGDLVECSGGMVQLYDGASIDVPGEDVALMLGKNEMKRLGCYSKRIGKQLVVFKSPYAYCSPNMLGAHSNLDESVMNVPLYSSLRSDAESILDLRAMIEEVLR